MTPEELQTMTDDELLSLIVELEATKEAAEAILMQRLSDDKKKYYPTKGQRDNIRLF